MRIGIINLMTRTADVEMSGRLFGARGLAPADEGEVNIVELAGHLVQKGHEVHVFIAAPYAPSERATLPGGLSLHYLPTVLSFPFSPSIAPFTPSLGRRARELRLDALMSGEVFQSGTVLGWLGEGGRTPFYVWQELDTRMSGPIGMAQGLFYATAGKAIVSSCAAVIPRSVSAREHLRREGLDGEFEEVVHSGVDTGTFKPMRKEECREGLALEGAEDILLAVGRLHRNKGVDLVMDCLPSLLARRRETLLVIKGTGPELDGLRASARRLGISDHVRFITSHLTRGDMARLYSAADALVITSRVDLFPFTAIESAACATPVLTSFGRGLKTDIVDKGAGLMLPSETSGLAGSLAEALSDKAKLRGIGLRARDLTVEEFDFDVSADRLIGIYRRHSAG
ncbi:MAG: glycosyltransferase family 4 protein [Methanomassiliicoccales archaeon]|nr:glycosyltransferase family 4 protein [Methanomassiliicoccales archaeon]